MYTWEFSCAFYFYLYAVQSEMPDIVRIALMSLFDEELKSNRIYHSEEEIIKRCELLSFVHTVHVLNSVLDYQYLLPTYCKEISRCHMLIQYIQ